MIRALAFSICLSWSSWVGADLIGSERPDLHAHYWASFGLALVLTEVLEGPEPAWGPGWGTPWATVAATVMVGGLGVVKELTDPAVDPADLWADAAGLATQAVLQWAVVF